VQPARSAECECGPCGILRLASCLLLVVGKGKVGADLVEDDHTEHRLGNNVKNHVEDGLAVGGEGGGTFGKNPNDGVEKPGNNGELHEALVEAGSVGNTVGEVLLDLEEVELADLLEDGDEGKHREGEENPLEVASDEGGDEARYDHEDVKEDEVVKLKREEALNTVGVLGDVGELPKDEGGGDEPVNVAGVVERAAVTTANDVTVASGHGEVSKGGNKEDEASNKLVELVSLGVFLVALVEYAVVKYVTDGDAEEPEGGGEEETEANPERPSLAYVKVFSVLGAYGAHGLSSGGTVGFNLGGASAGFLVKARGVGRAGLAAYESLVGGNAHGLVLGLTHNLFGFVLSFGGLLDGSLLNGSLLNGSLLDSIVTVAGVSGCHKSKKAKRQLHG